jgi:HPt (histidine-containing phosphotransfer) domain-containing protein
MADPRFDFSVLSEITGDDAVFERELLVEYIQTSADLIERQRECLDVQDAKELERAAHSLKGSSLTTGALRLGGLAADIERFARSGHLPNAVGTLEQAVREFAELKLVLESHIQRLAA